MSKKHKQPLRINTPIRTMHTANSFLAIGLFNANLSLRIGRYNAETGEYDNSNAHTTTVNYDEISILFHIAKMISDGQYENDLLMVLPCTSGATLCLKYEREQDHQMATYLIIDKNNQKFSFKFPTHTFEMKKNGQIATRIIQPGLTNFVSILEGFLSGIGLDIIHWKKLSDAQDTPQGTYMGNNSGYQGGSW